MDKISRFFLSLSQHGSHRIHYLEHGKPTHDCIVCVHGLTRNARAFDVLASALASEFRVVCPDVVGRGRSDWLPTSEDYNSERYLSDMAELISRLDVDRLDWVGTSLGGLIGMKLAAQGAPIRRLILNDIGPEIPNKGLQRIAKYIREEKDKNGPFKDLSEAKKRLQQMYSTFGALCDEDWNQIAEHSTRQQKDGSYVLHYDPKIGDAFSTEDVNLRHVWDKIRCPVFMLRGADSDILTDKTVRNMMLRAPCVDVETFANTGHAPALVTVDQVGVIHRWLHQTGTPYLYC